MPVKIRLMRIGAKKRPFYRVVAVDERRKRTGGYLELLGTYNPLTNPKEINLKQDRIDVWMKNGAVASDGFLRIIGQAPQRPIRPAKKAPKEVAAAPAPKDDVVAETEVEPAVETATEDAPAEDNVIAESAEPTPTEEVSPAAESEETATAEEITAEAPTEDSPVEEAAKEEAAKEGTEAPKEEKKS